MPAHREDTADDADADAEKQGDRQQRFEDLAPLQKVQERSERHEPSAQLLNDRIIEIPDDGERNGCADKSEDHAFEDEREADEAVRCADIAHDMDLILPHGDGNGNGVAEDKKKAVKWYRRAAKKGLPIAQFKLGTCYTTGVGTQVDLNEGILWINKAAEQGFVVAQLVLGIYYYEGKEIPQDFSEAAKWFRKAADQGDDVAQFCLAECYFYGNGVPQNFDKAVELYRKAAEQGHEDAKNALYELTRP